MARNAASNALRARRARAPNAAPAASLDARRQRREHAYCPASGVAVDRIVVALLLTEGAHLVAERPGVAPSFASGVVPRTVFGIVPCVPHGIDVDWRVDRGGCLGEPRIANRRHVERGSGIEDGARVDLESVMAACVVRGARVSGAR